MLEKALTPKLERLLLEAAKQADSLDRARRIARSMGAIRTELICADIELQLLAEAQGKTAEQLFGDLL